MMSAVDNASHSINLATQIGHNTVRAPVMGRSNKKAVNANADYSGIASYPTGIEYVFVNGEPVVSKGLHTEALPGRLLRAREPK